MMAKHPGKLDIQRLSARQPDAIERWFLAHCDGLYTFIYYRVGEDPDLAADLVQETFASALERIEQFDARRGTMLLWLSYMSRNCIARALRARNRQSRTVPFDERMLKALAAIASEPLPDEAAEHREVSDLVHKTMASIPAKYADILQDYYYNDRPIDAIANSTSATPGAVKTMLHRARQAFKKQFLRAGAPGTAKGAADE